MNSFYDLINQLAREDAARVKEKDQSYGQSWKKRGGVGAFMMLARKWDRIEKQAQDLNWDVFATELVCSDTEGFLDDIHDLRGYLLLVEAEILFRASRLTPEASEDVLVDSTKALP